MVAQVTTTRSTTSTGPLVITGNSATQVAEQVISLLSKARYGKVRVYISEEVLKAVKAILDSLGIRYRTVEKEYIRPPCIVIKKEGGDAVITTYNTRGSEVSSVRVPFKEFLEALKEGLQKALKKAEEIYYELVIPKDSGT